VELVLGHHTLKAPGGSETYLLTTAEHLQRLGHEVTILALEAGEMAQLAAARGLRVCTAEQELPPTCDGVVAQDGVVSLSLAARYPDASQLFVAHAPGIDLQRPVQLDGVVSAVIVLNDRVARRLNGLALQHEVVRLRQPIDVHRFALRRDPRPAPERVLLLSNYLRGSPREMLTRACADAGMRFEQLDIAASDIVVGHGRAALEGMASGRAVYVLDQDGGDGWVTPASYPKLESNGFAGAASDGLIDSDRVRRDLSAYRPEMGLVNRHLAFANHHAMDHACELVALLRRQSPTGSRPNAPLREMARLVRLQWQTEDRLGALRYENELLRDALERERVRAGAAHQQLTAFQRTRRHRLASLLARPLDALRSRR
jgi:hypothetical protein